MNFDNYPTDIPRNGIKCSSPPRTKSVLYRSTSCVRAVKHYGASGSTLLLQTIDPDLPGLHTYEIIILLLFFCAFLFAGLTVVHFFSDLFKPRFRVGTRFSFPY
ncbi:MAG: hypothetical protein JW776_02330 [Candidatus Lokiarchaeota archaeon]|nr:hypothetical protein [Candidatus Lokiarchaeota archaeon]